MGTGAVVRRRSLIAALALLSLLATVVRGEQAFALDTISVDPRFIEAPVVDPPLASTLPTGVTLAGGVSTRVALGDRGNFVVAIGRLVEGIEEPWARLAQYSFRDDGTVVDDSWYWHARESRSSRTGAAPTGIRTGSTCGHCEVWTADRFEDAEGQRRTYGRYLVVGNALSIIWPGDARETWLVDISSDPLLTKLTFVGSSYGANTGWAYGSRRGFSKSVSADRLVADTRYDRTYRGAYSANQNGALTGGLTSINLGMFRPCATGCSRFDTVTTQYLLAGTGGRRNYLNHQRASLHDDCIGDRSAEEEAGHLKPMLQVIDDAGRFRGWVMAEVGLYGHTGGDTILSLYELTDVGTMRLP